MIYAHIAAVNAQARGRRAVELSAYDLAGEGKSSEWHDTPGSTKGTERRWNGSRYVYRDKVKGPTAGKVSRPKRARRKPAKVVAEQPKKSGLQKLREANELRSKAAKIKNWYEVSGQWKQLTQAEAQKIVRAGKPIRKASVDEELDLDGLGESRLADSAR